MRQVIVKIFGGIYGSIFIELLKFCEIFLKCLEINPERTTRSSLTPKL